MDGPHHPGGERRNSFDAVRLIAALSVLAGHQFDLASYYVQGYAQPSLGPLGIKLSDTGLYVFFALSGYLVFQSLRSDSRVWRFASARMLRIYPGATVNTLACLAFGAIDTTLPWRNFWQDPATWSYLAHNLPIVAVPTQFGLPSVLADARWPAVNVPIWTLKYELLCYALLLVLYKLLPARRAWVSAALVAVAFGLMALFIYDRTFPSAGAPGLDSLGGFFPAHLIRFTMVFFSGAAYAACEPLNDTGRLFTLAIPAGLICFGLTPEFGRAGLILLVGLMAIEIGKSPALHSRVLRRIGDLSYGTYLYAFPIQLLTLTRLLNDHNFWLVTGLDLVLILGCAFLSWHLVEKPALRLKWSRGQQPESVSRPAEPTLVPVSSR